jgi:hypothetical protein
MWQAHLPCIITEHNSELIILEQMEGLKRSRLQYSLPRLLNPTSDKRRMS